jgi:hypothetical protein
LKSPMMRQRKSLPLRTLLNILTIKLVNHLLSKRFGRDFI